LAASNVRHVQIVDTRTPSDATPPTPGPANLVIHTGLTPVGIVGRNRARALRCLRSPDSHGRQISEDLRAQLLLRPRALATTWCGLKLTDGPLPHIDGRVVTGGGPIPGLYAAGWAGRAPHGRGSHADDAAAVVAALRTDVGSLHRQHGTLANTLAQHN